MDVFDLDARDPKSSSRERHETRERSRERRRKRCTSQSSLILMHHGHTERRSNTRLQHSDKRRRLLDGSRESRDGSRRRRSRQSRSSPRRRSRQSRSSPRRRSRQSRSSSRRRSRQSRSSPQRHRESRRGSSDRSMESKQESNFNYEYTGDSTQLLTTELINSMSNNKSEGDKFPLLDNVIPEFDPMIKEQTIHTWLSKVEECAQLYKWGEDQVIHYALLKLSGVAKTWYQTLPSMSYSWFEWKVKLTESFPTSDDYAELLTDMLSKRANYNDNLELYYYEKMNLLNRCEIKGKRAVDCLLHGINDHSLRLGAKATCDQPEQVLKFLQSIKQQPRDSDNRFKTNNFDKMTISNISNVNHGTVTNSKPIKKKKCFNCNKYGHLSSHCRKAIRKCIICNKVGHEAINCIKLPIETDG